jgi:hypothetical protein
MPLPDLPENVVPGQPGHADLHNAVNDQVNALDVQVADIQAALAAGPRLAGPLGGWEAQRTTAPAAAVVVVLGDSTSDDATNALDLFNNLRKLHTQHGEALYGLTGGNIVSGGNNGLTLFDWMADPGGAWDYNRDTLVAADPSLTVACWLINDIRDGALGLTVDAAYTAGRARLQAFVDWHRTALPATDLLLRMPNTLLSANVGGLDFVTDGTTVNPPGLAQIYSDALRRIYLSFVGRYPNVDVIDVQGDVFGTRSFAAHPYMVDQLHPSEHVSGDTAGVVYVGGGYVALAAALAAHIGADRNAFPPVDSTRTRHEFIVYSAPGAGQVRLISRDYDIPASRVAVTYGDTLYVNGLDAPQTVTAGIDRVVGPNFLQLTGLGSVDFTPYIGATALLTSPHGGSGASERHQIYVDPPAVAAESWVQFDVTVPGVAPGNVGRAVGVIVLPGESFESQTYVTFGAKVVGDDTVRIRLDNTDTVTQNVPGESWTFWVVR